MTALLVICILALAICGVVIWKQRQVIDALRDMLDLDDERVWLGRPPAK